MTKPGANIRKLRERLRNNLDVTAKQLAWNILQKSREISEISKGSLLTSWVIGVGSVNYWRASTSFTPGSWYEDNSLRSGYANEVRKSYTAAMTVTFSIPFFVSNSTPYLTQDVNLNREYGGTREDSLDGEGYKRELSEFAQAEAKRLFGSISFDRMYYQGITV